MRNLFNIQAAEIEARIATLAAEADLRSAFILTDANVAPLIDTFMPETERLVVPAGEESKSLDGARKVWDFLEQKGARRNSVLINVGGGMISDLGGFAASTFKRGIRCINLPTTLLAAVDAAIGGKTGINYAGLKNEIGTFSLPLAVLPFTSLFESLPEAEWLSGVGEAIKTGLLAGSPLYELATGEEFIVKRNPEVVEKVVTLCAQFKQKIVEQDFKEGGLRRILNLGHTAGHAIESLMMAKGTPVPHGVAVAYGLLETLEKSHRELGTDIQLLEDYRRLLHRYFPPISLSESDRTEMKRLMSHDKKNLSSIAVSWVLLRSLGHPIP
ncbi:MAG: 3-dehydroquinate synthase [Muribaculaceae bacterium]|nr:3-dehydroquinate synthase [Muribaculaceae bacterium]